jgi:hypothetical protein
MKISEMIFVLQAAERGEQIEYRLYGANTWKDIGGTWDFSNFDYRIAPKKQELSLVEELREDKPRSVREWIELKDRAADRIESLEIANESLSLERRATDELLAELKRRVG